MHPHITYLITVGVHGTERGSRCVHSHLLSTIKLRFRRLNQPFRTVSLSLEVCVSIDTYMCLYVTEFVPIFIQTSLSLSIHLHICIYIYICIYTRIYGEILPIHGPPNHSTDVCIVHTHPSAAACDLCVPVHVLVYVQAYTHIYIYPSVHVDADCKVC